MQRLVSLDVLRGVTIASMVMVNNPGSGQHVFPPLRHAAWSGWTFTDMVFPFFLWMVGLAMTFSFARRKESGGQLYLHALRRGGSIIGLGLLLNLIPAFDFAHLRIPGVLNRIGVCYLIAAAIFLLVSPRGLVVASAVLMAFYAVLMLGHGYPDPWSMGNNYARSIDGMFLSGHMYAATKVWDPEGIISTIPAVVTCLLGALAGYLVRSTLPAAEKIAWLFFSGNLLILAGLFMAPWMPINKALWTNSFVLLMAGLASVAFASFYWVCDVQMIRRPFEFFRIYGMNAIVMFVLSGLLAKILGLTGGGRWVWAHFYSGLFGDQRFGSLAFALTEVLLLFGVAYWMHRRQIFVRL